jgi:hypothetical protein
MLQEAQASSSDAENPCKLPMHAGTLGSKNSGRGSNRQPCRRAVQDVGHTDHEIDGLCMLRDLMSDHLSVAPSPNLATARKRSKPRLLIRTCVPIMVKADDFLLVQLKLVPFCSYGTKLGETSLAAKSEPVWASIILWTIGCSIQVVSQVCRSLVPAESIRH